MSDTDPPAPTTAIPELVAMPLSDEEFDVVAAAANTVHDLLIDRLRHKGGASLRCRIELAAAVLLGAVDHGRDAAIETGQMEPDAAMDLVLDLVTRRAMEIWGQGGA
jgi:hypothetical protein